MLELPESNTIASQLNNTIKGKRITLIEVNKSPHKFAWLNKNLEDYHKLLLNKTFINAIAYGGMVELNFDGIKLLLSDGVNIRYYIDESIPSKHQLLLRFNDDSFLVCSIQMYGGLWVFEEGKFNNPYYEVSKRLPSPLSNEFTIEYFQNLYKTVKSDKMSVKAFLATEQRIPGLGNGVLQDIIFKAKISPKRKLNTINEEELKTLYNAICLTLSQMVKANGRNTEKDLFGQNGNYETIMSNKNKNMLCPICGRSIIKEAYLGGSIYYCENCQH